MSKAELKEKIIAWIIATDDRKLLERILNMIEAFEMNIGEIEAKSKTYNKN